MYSLCVSHTHVGLYFYIRVLFIYDSRFYYFLDKSLVLNKILEPAIFIFKINANKISNTHLRLISKYNLDPIGSVKLKLSTKH